LEKQQAADTRVRRPEAAAVLDRDLKADKCLFPGDCPREVSQIYLPKYTPGQLEGFERFEEGTVVTPELLKENGLVKKFNDGIKILGDGELTKKLTVQAHKFSKSAKEKIEASGGKAEVI
jgi:ribosomal protein L15